MKTTRFFYLIIITFLFSMGTIAQSETPQSSRQTIQLESTILSEERTLTIQLPGDYGTSDNRYPVLYLLDGRTHLTHATGAVNFLSVQGSVPDMIIVSVHNVDRNRDFSPIHVENIPTSGGAKKFLSFLSEELTPYLDENFRTSGFNVLLGHSFGGTFAVYSLLSKPDLFDAYIAISPYLHFADNHLVKRAEKDLKPSKKGSRYFYMTVGDEPDYFTPLDDFLSALNEMTDGTIKFSYLRMKSENHATIPYISVFNGLRFIFADWQLPQLEFAKGLQAIDAHYSSVSANYGCEVQTPELVLNALGYTYLQSGEIDKAIDAFAENVKRYSGSANVHDSLGEAYEANSKFKLAEKNYQKAFELGQKLDDINLPVYKINLERIQQR